MGYISTGMGYRFGALPVSQMALRLTLVDRKPFWPCFSRRVQSLYCSLTKFA